MDYHIAAGQGRDLLVVHHTGYCIEDGQEPDLFDEDEIEGPMVQTQTADDPAPLSLCLYISIYSLNDSIRVLDLFESGITVCIEIVDG